MSVYGQRTTNASTHTMPGVFVATPRKLPLQLQASYLADVTSRASIDLRDGAQRTSAHTHHELAVAAGYDFGILSALARYRHVARADYTSHTFVLQGGVPLADGAARVLFQPYARFNAIERVGDPLYNQTSKMFGLRAGLQQLLDANTVVQVTYEPQLFTGYLSSPYVFVALGGRNAGCTAGALYCVPERNPDSRLQHALVLSLRRALTDSISVGLVYRFFVDDWSMLTHTAEPDVAWMGWSGGLVRLRYRAYFQSASAPYRDAAESDASNTGQLPQYVAADIRWAGLQTHRVSVDLEQTWDFGTKVAELRVFLTLGMYRVALSAPALEDTTALEGTAALRLDLF